MAESLEAAGAPPELVAKIASERAAAPAIQPANQIIVQLFFTVCTQWNYAGMSGARTGLNYAGVTARLNTHTLYRNLKPRLQDRVWAGIQTMELAALKQWQENDRP